MENFTLKSLFIFDPTLLCKKKKPSDEEKQDVKLLYYYPTKEDINIKRSNIGIIEGTIAFLDSFEESQEKFLISELNKCLIIADRFEENKYITMILEKHNSEFTYSQNVEIKKNWFRILINNFYEMFILWNGLINNLFFPQKQKDLREEIYEKELKALYSVIDDFVLCYFDSISSNKLPFLDNVLYFPLNEVSYAQLLLATQRLNEKIPEIKYTSIMYKGFFLHNEAPLDTITLIYNSFFNNLDSTPKFYTFQKPPNKIVQTVYSGENREQNLSTTSNFRKSFELIGTSAFLVGISRLNINNYHIFMPTVYFKSTKEKLKLLVFYQNGLLIFLFLNDSFNPTSKINSLVKMERWAKRYFDDEIPILENLYTQKSAKLDAITFAYVNNSNKSMKLSSNFFSKQKKIVEKEKIDLLFNIFKVNHDVNFSSISKIRGFSVYYVVSCDRKVVIILPDILNLTNVKTTIEDIKKDLFDYIFIL